jgi:hypothetical protein
LNWTEPAGAAAVAVAPFLISAHAVPLQPSKTAVPVLYLMAPMEFASQAMALAASFAAGVIGFLPT